ncbi:GNAT superfamily N-acetyltransferase [Microbacterium sp. BE35]|uniref:GNAT family N-acetyltransferase n=1 Tax=Microbacterium sp. BE35 TaxID=2817773 RepID=UPI00285CDE84|nr:GNAT family N-acetyltransferase [Microbacterium sp. BE35]MDR7188115.1 GNAT superfamily N-acetyltransferase [Microbacterium sp. BE35]
MTETIYLRGNPKFASEDVNDFFEQFGYGRPVSPNDVNGHITAVVVDGNFVGAAYAAAATSIVDDLFFAGRGMEGVLAALHVHALEALALLPEHRGNGHAAALVESIAAHARDDFGADHLLTRIDRDDHAGEQWWTRRQFRVCAADEALAVNGVPLSRADGYLDSWRPLTATPRTELTVVPAAPALPGSSRGGY